MQEPMRLSVVFLRRHFIQNVCCLMLIARLCTVVSYSARFIGIFLGGSMFQYGPVLLHCLYLMVMLYF